MASDRARTRGVVNNTRWNALRSSSKRCGGAILDLRVVGQRATCLLLQTYRSAHPVDIRRSAFGPRGQGFSPSAPVSLTSLTVGTMRQTSASVSGWRIGRRIDQPHVGRQREW